MENKNEVTKGAAANENAAAKEAAAKEALKESKAKSSKKFLLKQKELKVERANAIKKLQEWASNSKVELPAEVKAWIVKETTTNRVVVGQAFFHKVFGTAPKVGDSVTLLQYMKSTLKAKADLDKAIKNWAEKGIVVEYKVDNNNMLNSTYTIVKM